MTLLKTHPCDFIKDTSMWLCLKLGWEFSFATGNSAFSLKVNQLNSECWNQTIRIFPSYHYQIKIWDELGFRPVIKFSCPRSKNLHWGHVRPHTQFGPDRFSCFDVYWIQNRQTDIKSIYRYMMAVCNILIN